MANSPAYGLSNYALTVQSTTDNLLVYSNTTTGNTEFSVDGTGNVVIAGNVWSTGASTSYLGGSVGIGTTLPVGKLHVESAGTNYIYTRNSAAAGIAGVIFQNTTDTRSWRISGTDFQAYDNSAGAARMTINSTGNVGIGSTVPAAALDISATGGGSSIARYFNSNATAALSWRTDNGTYTTDVGIANPSYVGFQGIAANTAFLASSAPNGIVLTAYAAAPIIMYTNAGTERMRITSTGNVGIATINPSATLHVVGPGTAAGSSGFIARFVDASGRDSATINGGIDGNAPATNGTLNLGGGAQVSYSLTTTHGVNLATTFAGSTSPGMLVQGYVGIGTTSASGRLTVRGDTGDNATIDIKNNATNIWKLWNDNGASGLNFQYNGATKLAITNTGNVGVGNAPFQYGSSSNVAVELSLQSTNTTNAALSFQSGLSRYFIGTQYTNNLLLIGSNGTSLQAPQNTPIAITSGGNVLITAGTALTLSASAELWFNGQVQQGLNIKNTAANQSGAAIRFIDSTGAFLGGGIYFTVSSSVSYSASSDARLKTNISALDGSLSIINGLNPVKFNWTADGSAGEGFLAHELQQLVPLAVIGEPNAVDVDGKPRYQVADYSKIIPRLVAAIQELKAEFEAYVETHP
jgi:Chaperone of endosialidase